MISRLKAPIRALRRFLRRADGGTRSELAIWTPMAIIAFCFVTDAALVAHKQSQFYAAARDVTRQVASGQQTAHEAEAALSAAFGGLAAFRADVSSEGGYVTSTLSAPFSSFVLFVPYFAPGTLEATVALYVGQDDV